MKRKVLLIISIVIILLLLALAIYLIFKFKFEKEVTLQAESIKDNNESTEIEENFITSINLNLYLLGDSYNLAENVFGKNYVYEYSVSDIVVVVDNKYILPVNYGNCVLKVLDNDQNILCIYDINVYSEVVFNTSLTDICYINDEYYFNFKTNFSFENLSINTTIDSSLTESFKVLKNSFENESKEINISFKFLKTTNTYNNININTTICFDNYKLELNKTFNFNLYEKVNFFDVKYFNNEEEVSNNLYIIENDFYSNKASTDGIYTYLICEIFTNNFANYNVKIENNTKELITLLDVNKNEINDTSNVKKFYIYCKKTEGTASFTVTDLIYNYQKTFELNISKVYANEYIFSIDDDSKFTCEETKEFYLESTSPSYAYKKDFTILVDEEYITYTNNLMQFKKAGNTSINVLINNEVIKTINITILNKTTYECNLSSINLDNVKINNLDKTITVTNFTDSKNIVLNITILYNNQMVNFSDLNITTNQNYLNIESFDYPSFYIALKSTGQSEITFNFYDVTVTYEVYIS